MKSRDPLSHRFAILSLLQALVICLCIFLSIHYFGHEARAEKDAAALILIGSKEEPGWPADIAQGLSAACNQLGCDAYIEDNVASRGADLRAVTDKLVHRGVKNIFLANPSYQKELDDLAREYPQVNFYANSVGETVSYAMVDYSVRYYEVRYMAGVLAGTHTKTGIVGYIAPFPAPETRRDLNAFALGVRSVRPDARILVRWTQYWMNPQREKESVFILKLAGADVMTYFLPFRYAADEAQLQGLDYIDFHHGDNNMPSHCLAAIETDWQQIFTRLLQQNLRKSDQHIYWQGMLEKVVRLRLSPNLTPREEALTIRTRQKIFGGYPVFSGNLYDQYGAPRCREGEALSSGMLRQMDWLVKGVEILESR